MGLATTSKEVRRELILAKQEGRRSHAMMPAWSLASLADDDCAPQRSHGRSVDADMSRSPILAERARETAIMQRVGVVSSE